MIERGAENPNTDPRAFLVLDDCLYDNSLAREKLMRLLFMNGRHWKIMLVITKKSKFILRIKLPRIIDSGNMQRKRLRRLWIERFFILNNV